MSSLNRKSPRLHQGVRQLGESFDEEVTMNSRGRQSLQEAKKLPTLNGAVDENAQAVRANDGREIEKIVDMRLKAGAGIHTEYLVKWNGLDESYNSWIDYIRPDILAKLDTKRLRPRRSSSPQKHATISDVVIEIEPTKQEVVKREVKSEDAVHSTPSTRSSRRRTSLQTEESPAKQGVKFELKEELIVDDEESGEEVSVPVTPVKSLPTDSFVTPVKRATRSSRVTLTPTASAPTTTPTTPTTPSFPASSGSFITPERPLKRKLRGEEEEKKSAKGTPASTKKKSTKKVVEKEAEDEESGNIEILVVDEEVADESPKPQSWSSRKKRKDDEAATTTTTTHIAEEPKKKNKRKSDETEEDAHVRKDKNNKKEEPVAKNKKQKHADEETTKKKDKGAKKSKYFSKDSNVNSDTCTTTSTTSTKKSYKGKEKEHYEESVCEKRGRGSGKSAKKNAATSSPSSSSSKKGKGKVYDEEVVSSKKSRKGKGKKKQAHSDDEDAPQSDGDDDVINGEGDDVNNNNGEQQEFAEPYQNRVWRRKTWQELAKFARMHPINHDDTPSHRQRAGSHTPLAISSFTQSFKDNIVNEKKPKRRDANKDGLAVVAREFPSLQDLCMKLVIDNIECVESFGVIAPHLQRRMCEMMARRGKLNHETVKLFIDEELTHLDLSFAEMDPATINLIPETCKLLVRMSLTRCGKITDDNMKKIAESCPHIEQLCLHGAYRLTNASLCDFAHTHPHLKTLEVAWINRFTQEFTRTLASECVELNHLQIANCEQVDDKVIEPVGNLTNLLSLHIENPSPNFSDQGVINALEGSMHCIRKVSLINCDKVTDAVLRLLAQCPELTDVCVDGCPLLTDAGLTDFATSPVLAKNIRRVSVSGCYELSDEGIVALARSCKDLTRLVMPSLPKITSDSLLALSETLAQIEELDVSWCRHVDDEMLDMFLERQKRMHTITLWGCSRVTDLCVRMYRRLGKKVVGKL